MHHNPGFQQTRVAFPQVAITLTRNLVRWEWVEEDSATMRDKDELDATLGAARFEKYFTTRTQRLPVRYFGRDINDEKLTVLIKDRGHSSSSVKSMSSHKRDTAAPGSIGSSIVPNAVE